MTSPSSPVDHDTQQRLTMRCWHDLARALKCAMVLGQQDLYLDIERIMARYFQDAEADDDPQ